MMDFEKIDFSDDPLHGDHSFKMWFKIMWMNYYIQLFIICLAAIGLVLSSDLDGLDLILALAIPTAAALVICYKGFYQFWDDLKNGRSR